MPILKKVKDIPEGELRRCAAMEAELANAKAELYSFSGFHLTHPKAMDGREKAAEKIREIKGLLVAEEYYEVKDMADHEGEQK